MMGTAVTGSLRVSLLLKNTGENVPTTGWVRSQQPLRWNRKFVEGAERDTRRTKHVTPHTYNLDEGTKSSEWVSGSPLRSIPFHQWERRYDRNSYQAQVPVYEAGAYRLNNEDRWLFSDHSSAQVIATADNHAGGGNYVVLPSDANWSSVDARIYERTDEFKIITHKQFEYVESFTGTLTGTVRATNSTDPTTVTWANVSDRFDEFMLQTTTGALWFNKDHSFYIGQTVASVAVPVVGDLSAWQDMGYGQTDGRTLYTKYFPVEQNSVRLVVVDSGGTVTEWTEVTSLAESLPTENHFSVDHYTGVITTGGRIEAAGYLKTAITVLETTVEVYETDEVQEWPEQGHVVIGTESIAYKERLGGTLINCTRGFNGTTAAAHAVGDQVVFQRKGASIADTSQIYLAYRVVPRVDCEVADEQPRAANRFPWLDVSPPAQSADHKIIQIQSANTVLDRLVLTADRPVVAPNVYGPVYYGRDAARITATAYDPNDNPVSGVRITISLTTGNGSLGSGGASYTQFSNSDGQVSTVYSPGLDGSDSITKTTAVTHFGADTQMVVGNLQPLADVSEIWIYQILKHDGFYGTIGTSYAATAVSSGTLSGSSKSYVDLPGLLDDDYVGGVFQYGAIFFTRTVPITAVEKRFDGAGTPFTRVFTSALLFGLAVTDTVTVFKNGDIMWDAGLLNGVPVIVYRYDATATHPTDGTLGAYMPVQPSALAADGETLTISGLNLPIPDPNDDTNLVGAYGIVAPTQVELIASAVDEVTGNTIQSNSIKLNINLPVYLTGVDSTGASPIPKGWTVNANDEVGNALGGANFITINPKSGNAFFGLTLTGAL